MQQRSRTSATPRTLLVVRPSLGEGGADRVTLTLLRELDRRLFDPSLALQRVEGPHLEDLPEDVRLIDLGGHRLWTAWIPLARVLRRERPDILFSTSSGANVMAALARRCAGFVGGCRSRLVLSERGHLRDDRGLRKKLLALAKRALYRRADLVTTVSEGVAAEIGTRLGVPRQRIEVVYSPIVDDRLGELAAAALDHPWFEPADQPIILAAGRLVEEKDFQNLLRAFSNLRRRFEARLVLLGDGPLRPQLEALAVGLGIADDVDFAGFDKNPFRYMSRCAVFVLSSRTEGLPGVLIQAMACGAAVVSTDCPSGPSEIIEHGVSGLLVPIGDHQALASALSSLLVHGQRRSALAAGAREAAAKFRVENVIPRYQQALLGDKVVDR